MTGIEDRLREDLGRFAERAQPESIRPLRVPPAERRRATLRRLAPVAAAAAVAAVAVGAVLISRSLGSQPASAGIPEFYVTLVATAQHGGPSGTSYPQVAVVHDSATGSVLATARVPGGRYAPGSAGITAAADDRTFAITNPAGIFVLRVAADGRSASLHRLPAPAPGHYAVSQPAALSPDASGLAIAAVRCAHRICQDGLEVLSLATGVQKTWWSARSTVENLSWAPSGRQVMFLASSSRRYGYRLLSTAAPTGDLLAASRPITIPAPPGAIGTGMALLTPDGREVITTTYQGPLSGQAPLVTAKIVELSASTGRLLRVLRVAHWATDILQTPPVCVLLSLGAADVHPLVECTGLGFLEGSRFIPLPGGPGDGRWLLGAAW